ncbi:hypothetical protein LCGC14_1364280 [marine sediment metagenome]|uniref:Uncharacterized protein n=1 Tax=marine sediment metagenome TaxID=412755 RepID=A0A0F9MMC6_9ZZZZ
MDDNQCCCAHIKVSYRTREAGPGRVVEAWWECDSECGQRFYPAIPDVAPPPSDAAPVAWLAEDHLFTPVRRSLHFEESTARAHHGTHEADSDEPIPLYAHPEDAAPGTCSQCGGETYVVEITCCRNCSNEFYTRAQSLAASRALGLVHGRPGSPAAHPETRLGLTKHLRDLRSRGVNVPSRSRTRRKGRGVQKTLETQTEVGVRPYGTLALTQKVTEFLVLLGSISRRCRLQRPSGTC